MTLVETIKTKLLEARIAQGKKVLGADIDRNLWTVVLGEIQTLEGSKAQNGPVTDGQILKIVQKMIASNEETISAYKKQAETPLMSNLGTEKLRRENEILARLLPKACSREEMKDHLLTIVDQLKAAKSDGQATGVAMKALAGLEGSKDGKIVGEIVKELRS